MADIYNVVRGDGVFFEGMTKEQIISAIAEATGNTVQDIDSAFITKIKEINKGNTIRFWFGTSAEYNALGSNLEEDVLYICTDDTFVTDTGIEIQNIKDKIDANTITLQSWMNEQNEKFEDFKSSVPNYLGIEFVNPNGDTYITSMDVGSIKVVYNDDGFGGGNNLYLPSGGQYWVSGYWLRWTQSDGDQTASTMNINGFYDGGTMLVEGDTVGMSPNYRRRSFKFIIMRLA